MDARELAAAFLEELDARIAGTLGDHPLDSRARMAALRPMLRAKVIADPEGCAEFIRGFLQAHEQGLHGRRLRHG
jgi:hypothetical protein